MVQGNGCRVRDQFRPKPLEDHLGIMNHCFLPAPAPEQLGKNTELLPRSY